MEHYAGIDVSLERSSLCVVDATGKIIREAKVASEPEALVVFFRQLAVTLTRIGLEAGPLSQWLHAGLTKAGFEVVLLETRQVKAALSAMVVKTDRRDARGIAQLLRMGREWRWAAPASLRWSWVQPAAIGSRAGLHQRVEVKRCAWSDRGSRTGLAPSFPAHPVDASAGWTVFASHAYASCVGARRTLAWSAIRMKLGSGIHCSGLHLIPI